MICDWQKIRTELDSTHKDIFVTFRGQKDGQNGNRLQGELKLTAGLAVVGIKENKAFIFHLSTQNYADFESACKMITEYLTNNSLITEVILSCRHFNQAEKEEPAKLDMSKELKESLKTLGFRWLRLDNNTDGSRCTSFIYRTGSKERGDSYEREKMTRLNTGQILIAKIAFKFITLVSDIHLTSKESRRGSASLMQTTRRSTRPMASSVPCESSIASWTRRLSIS
jgi:hypothetical protein